MESMTARARPRLPVLLAAVSVSAVVLAGCDSGDDSRASDPNDRPTHSGKPSKEPTATGEPASSGSTGSGGTADTVAVPLYFVGDTPMGPRLFREFQQVEADNPVDEALAILAGGAANDPDYTSLLAGASLASGTTDEDLTIKVSGDVAQRPGGMSAKDAELAVQQVVFTVQGILQDRVPISFVTPDGASTTLFGLSTPDGGFGQDEGSLALVNVTEPEQDSQPGATFTASGVANSFEATVPWQVLDADGKKVLDGFATADGWGDKLYPWQSEVDGSGLAPGTYTFVAMTDDPSDGEGSGPTEDTKTFTIG
jgi:immunoglobulin-like protein involved in spore germination/sporulation and spore germination protein